VRIHSLILLAAAPLAGCVNTDTAVFVDPTLETPTLTVTAGLLGTSLSGAFHLSLHLGARASGPSSVTDPTFDLLDAQGATVVPSLPVTSSPTFPVDVTPDSTVDVAVAIDTGSKLLAGDPGADLCKSTGIVLRGKLQDSLQDTVTQVSSSIFHATCK